MSDKKTSIPSPFPSDCTSSDGDQLRGGLFNLFNSSVNLSEQKVIANNGKGQKEVKELKELAVKYSKLQIKTQRAVRAIQSYGKNCKEAAENFLEDGTVTELYGHQGDIEELKHSLEDASFKHYDIK